MVTPSARVVRPLSESRLSALKLLQRNLIYTGMTRGKRLLVLIGQKKAVGIVVRNDRTGISKPPCKQLSDIYKQE